ncbi:MAG: spore germination protein GerW family protein [Archaeoglobaceae archaeon]
MATEDIIRTMVDELQKLLATGNLIGQTMEYDDKIIIPVSKMGFGFGSGSGEGKGAGKTEGTGAGAAAGAGGGIGPVAIIVVFKGISGPDGIKVMQLEAGGMAKAVGEVASAATQVMEKKEK